MRDKQLLLLQIYNILRQGSMIVISVLLAKSMVPTNIIAEFEASMLLSVSFSFFAVAALSHCLYPLISGSNDSEKDKLYFHNFLAYTITGIIAAICIGLFSSFLTPELNKVSIGFAAIYTLFHTASFFTEHFLIIEKKTNLILLWGLGTFGLQILAVCVPLIIWHDLNLALGLLCALSVVRFIVNMILVLRKTGLCRIEKGILMQIFRLSGPVMLSLLNSGGFVYAIQYMVHAGSSPLEFALYRYGTREFPLFAILTNAFSSIYSSRLASGDKSFPRLEKLSHQVFIPAILLMICSPVLFSWFLNVDLAPSWKYFNILLLSVPAKLVFPQSVLLAMGQTTKIFFASLAEGLSGIILAILGFMYFGITGAVAALVCAIYIEKIVLVLYCFKGGISFHQFLHFKSLAIYSISLAVAFILSWIFSGV